MSIVSGIRRSRLFLCVSVHASQEANYPFVLKSDVLAAFRAWEFMRRLQPGERLVKDVFASGTREIQRRIRRVRDLNSFDLRYIAVRHDSFSMAAKPYDSPLQGREIWVFTRVCLDESWIAVATGWAPTPCLRQWLPPDSGSPREANLPRYDRVRGGTNRLS
jgi:hypothetical protein